MKLYPIFKWVEKHPVTTDVDKEHKYIWLLRSVDKIVHKDVLDIAYQITN